MTETSKGGSQKHQINKGSAAPQANRGSSVTSIVAPGADAAPEFRFREPRW